MWYLWAVNGFSLGICTSLYDSSHNKLLIEMFDPASIIRWFSSETEDVKLDSGEAFTFDFQSSNISWLKGVKIRLWQGIW